MSLMMRFFDSVDSANEESPAPSPLALLPAVNRGAEKYNSALFEPSLQVDALCFLSMVDGMYEQRK